MKILTGKVISTKMTKTAVVEVRRQRFHPLYKKIIRSSKKFKVQNDDANIKVGDMVKIIPTRPISKEKHFKIISKL